MDGVVKWPGIVHNAHVFANSSLNVLFKNGKIQSCPKCIIADKDPIQVFILGDSAYPLLPYLIGYANGGATEGGSTLVTDYVMQEV